MSLNANRMALRMREKGQCEEWHHAGGEGFRKSVCRKWSDGERSKAAWCCFELGCLISSKFLVMKIMPSI